jgi:hypothetical protein
MATHTTARDGALGNGKRAGGTRTTVATTDAPPSPYGSIQQSVVAIEDMPISAAASEIGGLPQLSNAGDANRFVLETVKFEAFGDRVLILEDEFKSGYECSTCNGAGKFQCTACQGHGTVSYGGPELMCSLCNGNKVVTCEACNGKGGLLVVPDDQKRRPTTGTIVSKGEDVEILKVGQSVLYSSFAGHTMDLYRATGEKVVIRILHEPEILTLVTGHLDLRAVRGKSEIAQFQN